MEIVISKKGEREKTSRAGFRGTELNFAMDGLLEVEVFVLLMSEKSIDVLYATNFNQEHRTALLHPAI